MWTHNITQLLLSLPLSLSQITAVGRDFAAKYSGLDSSASVQLSSIRVHLQQDTIVALVRLGVSLKPALNNKLVHSQWPVGGSKVLGF